MTRDLRAPTWDREQVLPDYEGGGISALTPTLLSWLGAPMERVPTLDPAILPPSLFDGVERIALILADGLGMLRLERQHERDPQLALRDLVKNSGGTWNAITSVAPSTTTSALATICTGLAPSEHGVLGYRMLIPEIGRVANMIQFTDSPGGEKIPVRPEGFVPAPTIFERLRRAGVENHVITRSDYIGSELSRMLHSGGQMHGYEGQGEMAEMLAKLASRPGRRFVFCYWDLVDVVSHGRGSESDEAGAEISLLDRALTRALGRPGGDGKTLFVLTADHGHCDYTPGAETYVEDVKPVARQLSHPAGGDSRFLYLYCKEPRAAEEAAVKHLPGGPTVLTRDRAVKTGLFGPKGVKQEFLERIGDLVVVPKGNHSYRQSRPVSGHMMLGRHGGLSRDEMLVPLISWRG